MDAHPRTLLAESQDHDSQALQVHQVAGVLLVEGVEARLVEEHDGVGPRLAQGAGHGHGPHQGELQHLLLELGEGGEGLAVREAQHEAQGHGAGDLRLGPGLLPLGDIPEERLPGPAGQGRGLEVGQLAPASARSIRAESERAPRCQPCTSTEHSPSRRTPAQAIPPRPGESSAPPGWWRGSWGKKGMSTWKPAAARAPAGCAEGCRSRWWPGGEAQAVRWPSRQAPPAERSATEK